MTEKQECKLCDECEFRVGDEIRLRSFRLGLEKAIDILEEKKQLITDIGRKKRNFSNRELGNLKLIKELKSALKESEEK